MIRSANISATNMLIFTVLVIITDIALAKLILFNTCPGAHCDKIVLISFFTTFIRLVYVYYSVY